MGAGVGAAVRVIEVNQSMLSEVRLPLPPREEQSRIVEEVERQMSFIEACERSVDTGLEVSATIRRSVLKAAFEGRLVSQDPTDEPASILLERIRGRAGGGPEAEEATGQGNGMMGRHTHPVPSSGAVIRDSRGGAQP